MSAPTPSVVITGGTGALGSAVVARMLEDGADCHVTWLHEHELERFDARDRVTLHRVDCAAHDDVRALYAGLERVDASIHLVGGFAVAPIEETTAEDALDMFRLNAITALLCCRHAVERMGASGGRIVNVTARPALVPTGGMLAYSTAKAAVASLTQCLAEEVRARGILVNAVAPSVMDTLGNRAAMPDADFSRWPTTGDVAEVVAFLASPRNRVTTGALVPVFGRA